MKNMKLRSIIVFTALIASWVLMFVVQWHGTVTLQDSLVHMPIVMVLMGLLAGMALNENEQ